MRSGIWNVCQETDIHTAISSFLECQGHQKEGRGFICVPLNRLLLFVFIFDNGMPCLQGVALS